MYKHQSGVEDAIVVPPINANNFELKQPLINLVQSNKFTGLLRQCPHHGFSELHQLDTFYNSLNSNNQDALDSATGGNFLDKMPQEGLAIIESKIAASSLKDKMTIKMNQMMKALVVTTPAPVKAVEEAVEETSTDPVPPPLTQKVQETNSQTTTKVNQEGYVNCPKTYELKLPYPERRNN
ncbi:hypothetical protein Tco_1313534 [Tanacetum coccineum]